MPCPSDASPRPSVIVNDPSPDAAWTSAPPSAPPAPPSPRPSGSARRPRPRTDEGAAFPAEDRGAFGSPPPARVTWPSDGRSSFDIVLTAFVIVEDSVAARKQKPGAGKGAGPLADEMPEAISSAKDRPLAAPGDDAGG